MSVSPITHFASPERLLFSREEAAQMLGLSVHTIARDCRLGKIAAKKYGRRVLIPKSEVLRLASEGMQPAEALQTA